MGKLVDRAKMSVSAVAASTGTGTGAFTLNTAVVGFNTFANAGVLSGDTVSYVAEEGTKWEYGESIYTSTSGILLQRNPTYSSQGSATPESFTTAATVFVAALQEDLSPDFMLINRQTAVFSYTLATGSNAFSVGPVAVGGGYTVTIPSSSRWVVI